jgi:predicted GH43/DUF377 family glycosyl hydrolase
MSKHLSLILILLFVTSSFAGCLGNSEEPDIVESSLNTVLEGAVSECNNTIIKNGTGTDFDVNFREIGNTLIDEENSSERYKLYYSAYSKNALKSNQTYIGYSYSEDGINWEKYHSEIISRPLEDPYVIKHEGIYHLFAEDKLDQPFRNIRKYHSYDGINWIDDGDVLDIEVGGEPSGWESKDVSSPVVWIESDMWHMLYEGRGNGGGKIGHATSNDGINWTRDLTNPIFGPGMSGSWDELQIVPDDLIIINGTYYLFYHGYSNLTYPFFKGGIAKSENLNEWSRLIDEPFADVNTLMANKVDENYLFYFTGDTRENSPTAHIRGICSFEVDEFELLLHTLFD